MYGSILSFAEAEKTEIARLEGRIKLVLTRDWLNTIITPR